MSPFTLGWHTNRDGRAIDQSDRWCKEGGTGRPIESGRGHEPADVHFRVDPFRLVRPDRRPAGSRRNRASQARVRSRSSLQAEPPLCLVGPGVERLCFRRTGIALVRRDGGLAPPRSLAFCAVMFALVVLPPFLVAFPRIYGLSWLVVALAMAARLVPDIERRRWAFRRSVVISFPVAIALVAIMATAIWSGDRNKQVRERARPLPAPGSPNVVLIVLDTVAARHLSLYGYGRATSTTLAELAERGIRFGTARASSSWTLPSHATMFTGRWMHDLSVGWLTPLDRTQTTVAEFLGARGYATAGFVANTAYCAADSGLARGFTVYQDYFFPELTALKTAALFNRASEALRAIVYLAEDWLQPAGLLKGARRLVQAVDGDRKDAAEVNLELIDWLAHRAEPDRPFFAFLNYFDAHFPYRLPPGRLHRFGVEPTDEHQRFLIDQWGTLDKSSVSPAGVAFAADAYDDCVADLDEQLGILIDELNQQGILQRTWLVIVADHGESFGEHAGIFCHGASLYDTEVHVPLVILPPGGITPKKVVEQAVSLRDLATTIVDIVGQKAGSPFPGASLAPFWQPPAPAAEVRPTPDLPALAELVPAEREKRAYWRVPNQVPPVGAVKNDDWSFVRRDVDGREELFHLSKDLGEQHNLAGDPSAWPILRQMRATMGRMTGGPLLPRRFSP